MDPDYEKRLKSRIQFSKEALDCIDKDEYESMLRKSPKFISKVVAELTGVCDVQLWCTILTIPLLFNAPELRHVIDIIDSDERNVLAEELARRIKVAELDRHGSFTEEMLKTIETGVAWAPIEGFQDSILSPDGFFAVFAAKLSSPPPGVTPERILFEYFVGIAHDCTAARNHNRGSIQFLFDTGSIHLLFNIILMDGISPRTVTSIEFMLKKIVDLEPGLTRARFKPGSSLRLHLEETVIDWEIQLKDEGTLNWFHRMVAAMRPATKDSNSGLKCKKCGDTERDSAKKLFYCSRCRDAGYCSKECQKADWKRHKPNCRPVEVAFVGTGITLRNQKANKALIYAYVRYHYLEIMDAMRRLRRKHGDLLDITQMLLWLDLKSEIFGVERIEDVLSEQRLPWIWFHPNTQNGDRTWYANNSRNFRGMLAKSVSEGPLKLGEIIVAGQSANNAMNFVSISHRTSDKDCMFTTHFLDHPDEQMTLVNKFWPYLHSMPRASKGEAEWQVYVIAAKKAGESQEEIEKRR